MFMLNRKKILFAIVIGALIGLWAGNDLWAQYVTSTLPPPPPPPDTRPSAQQQRTPSLDLHFNVRPTIPQNYEDVQGTGEYAADLKDPSNITSVVEFDPETGCYVIHTRLGDNDIVTPYIMSPDEYSNMDFRRSMMEYYRKKNAESAQNPENDPFNFLDMQFGLGPLDKVFGPGGVQLKTTGAVDIKMGVKSNSTDNPALSMSQRRKTYFDFDQQIQANVAATVGDKMKFNMTYNTAATFDFDSKSLKLAYEGKEDEIIKNIEAGNVSMTTGSSLIHGSAALFGIKTKLQFGKLTATALVSQQNSETQTVSSKGGSQTTEFNISADKYDQNRNFFLSHFFRENYDRWCSKLPVALSGIQITRIEVWVTNKRSNFNESRNIMAFMDVGEGKEINLNNKHWIPADTIPDNSSNDLLETIRGSYPDARYMSKASTALDPLKAYGFEGGDDYEKIESARLLSSADYTLNSSLGYIMLKTALSSDEILAVAYSYTYNGVSHQVGEFSGDVTATDQSLYVKMLKGTTSSPYNPMWDLAMKNVYALGAYQIQRNNFKLNIKYLSDTTGNELTYIPDGAIKGVPLLQVMNLDRLDANQEANIDGKFDYIENYTVESKNGKIIFPVAEPFGAHLRSKFGNDTLTAKKYIYTELYDSTLTVAQQFSDKNKFVLAGEYQSSSGSVIRLNATNVAKGSVVVTAGGVTLTENADYTVDYTMGTVTITNTSIIDAGTNINVSLENQSTFNMQRKTLLGLDLDYAFNKNFHIGGTVMHYGEKAIGDKVAIGSELVNNTIWGMNLTYNTQFMWLTNLLNKIPTVNATAPSTLTFQGEFAQLLPHQAKRGSNSGSSYIDDFESTQSGIDIRAPYSWFLSATPLDPSADALFPEASLSNQVDYGKNRALLSWYYIDRLFTQRNSSYAPGYIKNDLDALSYPYARSVSFAEVFPGRELNYGESSEIQTLNLSFYPNERGPYNLDATFVNPDGSLQNPEKRWGGIMRKIDNGNTNFEQSNIEYIQFWMLDPFMDEELDNKEGGYLYFNLGEVSEDILKDGLKSYENGLPINGDTTYVSKTEWGKVSSQSSLTYAFDNTNGARILQDVGLDGLSTDEEKNYSTYSKFITDLRNNPNLADSTKAAMDKDPFSPFNDPASDNYAFYRHNYYDQVKATINERYKHYNNTDGNSLSQTDASDTQYQTARSTPDVEDINQDNTLNEYERYFQYKVHIHPDAMKVGMNYITDMQEANVHTRNGDTQKAKWYQFTIPLSIYDKKVGNIQDFSTIRFIRMFMTGFKATTHLRFASLELVRGEWRNYKYNLNMRGEQPANGSISINTVNIEENASRDPVNYVLPPGVSRIIDSGQSQITQLNEQSMQLVVDNLDAGDARGVYRNTDLDLRTYKRLQMFVHNEATVDNETSLRNGDVSLFVRLGSDVKNNYYEYEIPLTVTPSGKYNSNSAEIVWPEENMLDIDLDVLVNAKKNRNADKMAGVDGVGYSIRYQDVDNDHPNNKVYVMGNPSLSKVRVMLIGVRNNAPTTKSCVVWVDELRVTDFDSEGGWAAKASMTLNMSDIATLNMGFHKETEGFGSVDQSLSMRRLDNYNQYNIAVQSDLGRFIPEKAKLHAPIYYSYTNEKTTPKYNPLDQDVKLDESLDICETKAQKDSIMEYAVTQRTAKSFSISGLKFGVKTMKNPMPWDPDNFSFSYSFNKQHLNDPENVYENTNDYRGSMQYSWSPYGKVKPFSYFINEKNKHMKFFREWEFYYLPTNIAFGTNISRYYHEQQTRNETGINVELPISVSKNFLWDRKFVLTWNFTTSLSASFNSNTTAHIIEPVLDKAGQVVDRKLYPDQYQVWKDSVMQSIRGLGTPWAYSQTFNVTYRAPFSKIPILSWITANASYNSIYKWDRGTVVDSISSGNIISNNTTRSIDGQFNLDQFYGKIPYLKKVNERFGSKTTSKSKVPKKEKAKKFSRTIKLNPDTVTIINHKMGVKKVKVQAMTTDGKPFKVDFKVKDKDNIEISTLGTENLKFTITEIQSEEKHNFFTEAALYTTRLLMSVRNIKVNWKHTTSLSIPQFVPEIGDFFGQTNQYDVMAPGLDFAFGFAGLSYIEKAQNNRWLKSDRTQITPAIYGNTKEFLAEIQIEPIAGLKINLKGLLNDSRSDQIQFMYDNPMTIFGGRYNRTHIALATALQSVKASDNYHSATFDKFLQNIDIVADRIQQQYMGTTYPEAGFFLSEKSKAIAGRTYSLENGRVNKSSSDVLIPAFMAAYSGKDANKVNLNPFPGLKSILPNWRITYDGLMRIPFFKKLFKTFSLTHVYTCTYDIGSYTSFNDWVTIGNGLGFIQDVITYGAIPSSPYNIASVILKEEFKPLIGFNATFNNDISINAQYDDQRTLTLNPSAGQLVEASSTSFTLGASYTIANFNQVLKIKKSQQNVNNDLKLSFNAKMSSGMNLIRKIDANTAQATNGTRSWNINFMANYVVSKRIELGAFFDYTANTPMVSTSSYPTTSSNYGLSIKMNLVK